MIDDSASAGFETGSKRLKEGLIGDQKNHKVGAGKGMINPVISLCQPE